MTQQNYFTPRRGFLKKASAGVAAAVSIPQIVGATALATEKKVTIHPNDVILFQGDSITDSGRKKDASEPNATSALGSGYAMLAGGKLLEEFAGKNLKIYNKGISGNKVFQLADRWEADCLALKPNVLSILIGVNDFWHKKNGKYDGTVEVYRDDYMALLERTKKALPDVKLIIGEPFAISGTKAVDESWFPEFDGYRKAAREVADQFDAAFIPYQQIFTEAEQRAPGAYWAPDGVHPSLAGAELMAQTWLKMVR